MPRLRSFLPLAALLLMTPGMLPWTTADAGRGPRAYYVSPAGDDGAAGTAPEAAWRTLRRASRVRLRPGDRLLLHGGTRLRGNLELTVLGGGSAERPVVLSSYGPGRATIVAGAGTGVFVPDAGGVALSRLEIVGDGPEANRGSGVLLHAGKRTRTPLRGVRVEDVEVSGFGRWGVGIGSAGAAHYEEVRVRRVHAHRNGVGGIFTYGERPYLHRDVQVSDCHAHANPGRPGEWENSGHGIALGSVDGGAVRGCRAHHNGGFNDAEEGGVGIWAYDSRRLVIERNASWGNRTGGPSDGGGFDLDHNVADSVLQDNVSYDNDGAGYLLYHRPDTPAHGGNVVRRNLSRGDGRRNGYGGIRIAGRNPRTLVTQNRVEIRARGGSRPAALQLWTPHPAGFEGLEVTENHLVASHGALLVDNLTEGEGAHLGLRLARNRYETRGSAPVFQWSAQRYDGLEAWRWATGQG